MLKVVSMPMSGNPAKICDAMLETIVDEYMRRDPKSRLDLVAVGGRGMAMLSGIVDSQADFDAAEIAKHIYRNLSYDDDLVPFVHLERPAEDRARSIVEGGAEATVVTYGYATRETREMLPRPLVFAESLVRRIEDLRSFDKVFSWLRADGNVVVAMDGGTVQCVSVDVEHAPDVELTVLRDAIHREIIIPLCGNAPGMRVLVNVEGKQTTGGFLRGVGASGQSHTDLYGGLLPQASMSMVGKDPLHPARAGTLMARAVARQLVAEGLAGNLLVTLCYVRGMHEPTVIAARSGAGEDFTALVKSRYDLRPEAILERLHLRQPLYADCAMRGVFGREELPWESMLGE